MKMNQDNTKIMEYIDLLNSSSEYLLTFSPFFINHVSVNLMTDVLLNRKKSVLYICVGRPHIFVQKILMNRGVSTRSIHFMDMVLYVCRELNKPNPSKIMLDEDGQPIEMPTIYKLFKVDQEVERLSIDEVDLMILDNLSELRTYNNDDQIKRFLELLDDISKKKGKGLILFHLNNRPGDGIPELVKSMGIEILDIPNEAFRN
jgi:hypothetical protein